VAESHLKAIQRQKNQAELVRGHTDGDELCEIAGVGPAPVDAARRLLGESILKLVITAA
jgi:hypothetical protein